MNFQGKANENCISFSSRSNADKGADAIIDGRIQKAYGLRIRADFRPPQSSGAGIVHDQNCVQFLLRGRDVYFEKWSARIASALRTQVFSKAISMSFTFLNADASGNVDLQLMSIIEKGPLRSDFSTGDRNFSCLKEVPRNR